MAQVTIKIDYENNAKSFWSRVATMSERAAKDNGCPHPCTPLILGARRSVTVTAEEADAFRTWIQTIPGWDDGPAYARDPFVFSDE